MKVCPLTRISSPAPEIGPNVLYRHSPTEHTVILEGSIIQTFLGVYDPSGV